MTFEAIFGDSVGFNTENLSNAQKLWIAEEVVGGHQAARVLAERRRISVNVVFRYARELSTGKSCF